MGYRPVINLKNINWNIQYLHFKMEGLFLLKDILQRGSNVQTRPERCLLFSSSPCKITGICSLSVGQKDLSVSLPLFWTGSKPRVFTKRMKISIAVLRRLNVRLIIFLDDILLMGSSKQELIQAKDTLIFLLQSLGFLINIKKSELKPTQKFNFWEWK